MALITCLECGKSVSDLADKCVSCGAPIMENKNGKNVYVTNKKKGKVNMLVGWLLLLFGIFTIGSNSGVSGLLILMGIIVLLVGKFKYWWHNRQNGN